MRTLLPLVVLALVACETRATQEECPGAVQGTFRIVGELVDGAACAETGGAAGTLDLSFAVSFTGDGGAAVCLQRTMAEPLLGTRDGDRIEVSAPLRSGTARGCACTVQLVERISGVLIREGDAAVGFSGELSTDLTPADGATSCAAADDGDGCAVPCSVRWALSPG